MSFLDTALVVIIVLFLILIVWSRIMNQRMLDTVMEIKAMMGGIKK